MICYEKALNQMYKFLNDFYISIDSYIKDQKKYSYNDMRKLITDIVSYKNNLISYFQQYDSKYFYDLVEEMNEGVFETFTKFICRYEEDSDITKLARYKSVVFNPSTLEKLLSEDAITDPAKKCLEILEAETGGMEIQNYLFFHSFPEDERLMTDEQFIVRDVIESIFSDLSYLLDWMYFQIYLYYFHQTDPDYYEMRSRITDIEICESKIDDIVGVYFQEDSSITSYKDINKINDDAFNKALKFIDEENVDAAKRLDFEKYKNCMSETLNRVYNTDVFLFCLLRDDAYTDNAKRYFGLDIEDKDSIDNAKEE